MRTWIAFAFATLASLAAAQTQLIVRLRPNADPNLLAVRYGVTFVDRTANAPFALFLIPSNLDSDMVRLEFQADGSVVWAEDNAEVSDPDGQSAIKGSGIPAIGDRNALYAANPGMLKQINWSRGLAFSLGRPVRIAVLDTGLSQRQGYLWAKVDASDNFIERGSAAQDRPHGTDSNGNGLPDEGTGHGTMIAGLIDEIAPQTRMIIARVADSDGVATAWTIIEGLAFAETHGAEVANISLGTPNQIAALSDVIDWCEDNNLLVVAGIGNADSRDAMFPARYSAVICVAGLNPDNTKASFSNWDGKTNSAAPATGIISQWWDGRLGTWAGTSFSAPMVSAAIADCLRRTNILSTSALRNAVKNSGTNIDALNPLYQGQIGTLLDIQNLDRLMRQLH